MTTSIDVEFLWIPAEFGGHRSAPYLGMRPMIRWERFLKEHLDRSRDVECTRIDFDHGTQRGKASLRLVSDDPVPIEWLYEGNLIELLDGFRVIAIGRIVADHP